MCLVDVEHLVARGPHECECDVVLRRVVGGVVGRRLVVTFRRREGLVEREHPRLIGAVGRRRFVGVGVVARDEHGRELGLGLGGKCVPFREGGLERGTAGEPCLRGRTDRERLAGRNGGGFQRSRPRGSRGGLAEQGGESSVLTWVDWPVGAGLCPRPGETSDDHGGECGRQRTLGGGLAAPSGESPGAAQGDPAEDQEAGQQGQHHTQDLDHVGGDVHEPPVAPSTHHSGGVLVHHVPGRTEQSRNRGHQGQEHQHHHRDGDQHPQGDHRACPRLEHPVFRVGPPVRQQPTQGGTESVPQVGHTGQVGQQVIAVEAQQRHELLHHLHRLGGHQEQQGVPAREVPPAEGEHHDQGVEVQAAQVGADSPSASQAVAVGHVGVERRPHDVEARSHHAGIGSAVARGRRMPELVEAAREHGHHEHEQQQVGSLEGVVRRGGEPLVEKDPPGDGQEPQDHRRGHHRLEEDPERVGQ